MTSDFEVIRDVKEDDSVCSLDEDEDDEDTKEVIRSYIG
jgi:hypothetical protein